VHTVQDRYSDGSGVSPTRKQSSRSHVPGVEVEATPLIGDSGAVTLLDVFEGRWMLIAS
jgi:hypothetical protein